MQSLIQALKSASPTLQQWAQAQVLLALRQGAAAAALSHHGEETPAELPAALSAAIKMMLQNMTDAARENTLGLLGQLVARNAPGTAGAVGAFLRQLPCSK